MYYERHGDGEPLVLIVGLGTDISEWHGIIHWLAQKYKVLAFDNRGAGRTDKPDAQYSIEVMAHDIVGLMQALDIKQAYILGISMGGRIALALALQYPKSVKKLVLVSTSARSIKSWRSHFFSILSGMPIFRSKYPQPHYAFMRQRQASFVYNCTDKLRELQIPTVIMHGKKDKTAPYTLAEEMHIGIKGSKMLTFAGGHLFFVTA
jgi:3-oxoadipate enol-lactonase